MANHFASLFYIFYSEPHLAYRIFLNSHGETNKKWNAKHN